jgi:gamma-glutamylcyclotransferase (GGCT)/AIG2-like uncharacterized protein YtfP
MTEPLFVYGTLMAGASRGALLGDAPRVAATCTGRLYDLPAGYPALDPSVEGVVHGELIAAFPSARWGVLDLYEGVGEGLYRRVKIDVRVGLRRFLAWSYVMDDPAARGGVWVRDGRWRCTRRR